MLNVITREEAVRMVRALAQNRETATETIPTADALGRYLAAPVRAAEDVPGFDRTTVDGYAVLARDTYGASDAMPSQLDVIGEIAMGQAAGAIRSGQCFRISTGGMLPQGADAAVMVEHTDETQGLCLVYKAVSPGENITVRGADVRAGDIVLTPGARMTPASVGVLAALGIERVEVFRPCSAAVLSTGDELTRGAPAPGQIRDVNSDLLASSLSAMGCAADVFPALPDDRGAIRDAIRSAAETHDAVFVSGGSSAGMRDLTVSVLDELGEVLFHGLAMKPGKPTILGLVGGKPVFGLPGHPLAAYFVLRLVFAEYFRASYAVPPDAPFRVGKTAVNIPSNHGREEFCCATLAPDGSVAPIHTKSGIISVLTRSNCILRIPRESEGLPAGAETELYRLFL